MHHEDGPLGLSQPGHGHDENDPKLLVADALTSFTILFSTAAAVSDLTTMPILLPASFITF